MLIGILDIHTSYATTECEYLDNGSTVELFDNIFHVFFKKLYLQYKRHSKYKSDLARINLQEQIYSKFL